MAYCTIALTSRHVKSEDATAHGNGDSQNKLQEKNKVACAHTHVRTVIHVLHHGIFSASVQLEDEDSGGSGSG
jgi:hypothetical protein